jgi:hypothetical protein
MVVMSERLEKRPGATSMAFLPPIFAGTASVSMFRVFPPPPLGNAEEGGLYICVLGQAEDPGTKMDNIGASRLR